MSALKAICLRLGAVWALLLVPLAAQATLYLEGPSEWYPGQTITISLKTDDNTLLNTFFFDSQYWKFASVLEIHNQPVDTLPVVITAGSQDSCNSDALGDICSFSYVNARNVLKDTVVTQWQFLVKEDAPLGPVGFDLDLLIEADMGAFDFAEPIDWPETKQFQVLAIPEPSSWALMLAGFAAVGARAYRRRIRA